MIQLLNEDLAGEYQAIIAYTVYSQVLKGAAYTDTIFAGRHIQPHFQSFQLGLRGEINPAILTSEFQGPQFAVGQLRGHRFGAGLGLSQQVASLPNAAPVKGVFDNPGLIPRPGDFLRAEANMHAHRIAFHVQRRTLGRSATESLDFSFDECHKSKVWH